MKRGIVIVVCLTPVLGALFFLATYWVNTQPVWVVNKTVPSSVLDRLPKTNKKIIQLMESHGTAIAPDYERVVCTEFVIKVIDNFNTLTGQEKNDIRIISNKNIGELVRNDSPKIRGVQTALSKADKGIVIERIEDVKPGDFVQFWNVYQGKQYGHCGVVLDINPHWTITLYSSHPVTNGFGKHQYWWPDKLYFVRLK